MTDTRPRAVWKRDASYFRQHETPGSAVPELSRRLREDAEDSASIWTSNAVLGSSWCLFFELPASL